MSDEATQTAVVNNTSGSGEPPPIALLLPLLRLALAGSALLFRLGTRFLLSVLGPLRTVWTITHGLLSPITTVVKITFEIVVLIPFSIISMVAVALYPVYVFCAVACIVGAAMGFLGRYASIGILDILARSKYFVRPSSPPTATPSGPQVMLRKRKRKSVRLQ